MEMSEISLIKEKSYNHDETLLFLEFTSRKNAHVTLWGQEVPFSLTIRPKPHILEYRKVKLSPARQKIYAQCLADKSRIEAMLLPPPDEDACLAYCNVDTLEKMLDTLRAAWKTSQSIETRMENITGLVQELSQVLATIELPAEYTRIDTRLGAWLKATDNQLGAIAVDISSGDFALPAAVDTFWDHVRHLIARLEEGYGLLAGVARPMTDAEKKDKKALEIAFAQSRDFDERLEIFHKQWSNELDSPLERLVHIRHALSALEKKMTKAHEPASLGRPTAHLTEVQRALDIAEKQGPECWNKRMASEYITCARDWAPDDVAREHITEESFAQSLMLCEVAISTTETEEGIFCEVTFGFKDSNDYLSGHTLYAINPDGVRNNQPVTYTL